MIGEWAQQEGKLVVPCVGPGYDDRRIRPWNARNTKHRQHGAYYRRMFDAALALQPSLIGITSFNEWHEGTQIEPSQPFYSNVGPVLTSHLKLSAFQYEDFEPEGPLHYLDITAEYLSQYQSSP